MTPEDVAKLKAKRWESEAKRCRPAIRFALASALQLAPEELEFADRDTTERLATVFAKQLDAHPDLEFPGREAAIRYVAEHFKGVREPAFLLVDSYESCGVVPTDMESATVKLDELLRCNGEMFRVVSADGAMGACLVTQEGSDPRFPRYVNLWKRG